MIYCTLSIIIWLLINVNIILNVRREDDTWEPESGVGHLDIIQEFITERKAKEKRKRKLSQPEDNVKTEKEKSSYTNGKKYILYFSESPETSPGKSVTQKRVPSERVHYFWFPDDAKTFWSSDFKIPKKKNDAKSTEVSGAVEEGNEEVYGDVASSTKIFSRCIFQMRNLSQGISLCWCDGLFVFADEQILRAGLNDDLTMIKLTLGRE